MVKKVEKKIKAKVASGKKEEQVSVPEKTLLVSPKEERYFYSVGKRKTAIAQVRIYPAGKATKEKINGRDLEEYFPVKRFQETVKAPFLAVGQEGKFDLQVKVGGGGISAQAQAIRLGISRALVKFDENFKKQLRDRDFMTRDSRIVERKKSGLKKARKAPQWAKR